MIIFMELAEAAVLPIKASTMQVAIKMAEAEEMSKTKRLDLEKTKFDMVIEGARSQCSQGHSYRKVQVKIEEELCLKL